MVTLHHQEVFDFEVDDLLTFSIPVTGWYRFTSSARGLVQPGDSLILGVGVCAGAPAYANLIAFKRRWQPGSGGAQHTATSCSTEYYFEAGDTASMVAFSKVGPAYISSSENTNVSCRLIV